MRSLLLSLALLSCAASTALAQDFEAAGKHFSAAQDAFGKKHYKLAATEFESAYAISKDPVLLFNIAESWEKAGDGKKAVASYRQYLAAQPEAQDKGEVDKRIRAIEAKNYKLIDQSSTEDTAGNGATIAQATPPSTTPPSGPPPAAPQSTQPTTGEVTPPGAPPPVPPSAAVPERAQNPATTPPTPPEAATNAPSPETTPAPTRPPPGIMDEGPMSRMRVAAWIGVGSTLALLAAGAILGLAAESRGDEISRQLSFVDMSNQPNKYDMPTDQQLAQLRSDGNLYNGLAIGFFSAAAASAVITTVLFIVDAKRPKALRALRLAPTLDKTHAGLALGWSF